MKDNIGALVKGLGIAHNYNLLIRARLIHRNKFAAHEKFDSSEYKVYEFL